MKTYLQATFDKQIGQFLDTSSTSKKFNLDRFTMNRYNSIAYSKSSEIAFLMPVFLAMHYAGIEKVQEMFKQSETILLELGQCYQIQDDCLGCFFDLRKDNTDIEEGKCMWLIVKALELVTPEQRKTLEVNIVGYMCFPKRCCINQFSYFFLCFSGMLRKKQNT
ncbi:farnesyl pyrophosphate synthase-like [Solenopsis invicta]|uniref:farnesyl pyrophosphate synthase-like n=1 Tax=Solenopsis invicta TaxID=13686 RepID=UPI00193DA1C3|nr:farnesyl pyrophosphate synthase-like [Solenopsis invicta]XP_039314973.1 farnesyl pyrophosphate synthase-like [Solenopsis invicta]